MQRATLTLLLGGASALTVLVYPGLTSVEELWRDEREPHISDLDLPVDPPRSSGGGIRLSATLDRDELELGGEGEAWLVIEIAGTQKVERRRPLAVALVMDTSGSMAEEGRIEDAREAARTLTQRLGADDELALVSFDDQPWLRIPMSPAGDPARFQEAISSLSPGGGTNLYAGLDWGISELSRSSPEHLKRVVLISDGAANIGVTDHTTIVQRVREMRRRGIGLSALGVGLDFDESLLDALADAGGGTWSFADEPGAIPALLSEELDRFARTLGYDAMLELEPGQGASLERVLGRPDGGAPQQTYVNLGDLFAGETRKVIARVRLPTDREGPVEYSDIRLNFSAPDGEPIHLEVPVRAYVRRDAEPAEDLEPALSRKIAEALAADAMRRSVDAWASEGQARAREQLQTVETELDTLGAAPSSIPELSTWLDAVNTPMAEREERRAMKQMSEVARDIAR